MPTSAVELAERLGLSFDDPALLAEALVHSSYVNEQPEGSLRSNERLEFLGDAVLSLDHLGRRLPPPRRRARGHPHHAPGSHRLHPRPRTRLPPSRPRRRARARPGGRELGRARPQLGAGGSLRGPRGGHLPRCRPGGWRGFVLRAVAPELEAALPADALKAPKSRFQERALALTGRAPAYRIVSSEGPDHDRHFVVEASIDGRPLGEGEGRSRREAETMAAQAALTLLDAEDSAALDGSLAPDSSA